MMLKGTLKGITTDFVSGAFNVTFETGKLSADAVNAMRDKTLRIVVKQWREKRTLDANAYYWVLIGKLADSLKVSRPALHNRMLSRYGEDETIDGQTVYIVLPDTDEASRTAERAETYHLRPTSETREGRDGKTFRTWVMLKGSRNMNTKQFARLLDGLIDECNECHIPTATPREVERMMEAYGKHHAD